jgi:hypothetical protein
MKQYPAQKRQHEMKEASWRLYGQHSLEDIENVPQTPAVRPRDKCRKWVQP